MILISLDQVLKYVGFGLYFSMFLMGFIFYIISGHVEPFFFSIFASLYVLTIMKWVEMKVENEELI